MLESYPPELLSNSSIGNKQQSLLPCINHGLRPLIRQQALGTVALEG